MNNFNFDTTFTKGKNTYTIVGNEVAQVIDGKRDEWLSISGASANALIAHWLEKVIIPQINKANVSSFSFEALVKEVVYLENGLAQVNSLKGRNCSYRNKSREELGIKVHTLGSSFYAKISWGKLSTPQVLILKKLSGRSTQLSSSDLQNLYNPVTDDDTKLKAWHKELTSFNYKKYGVNKDSILKESSSSDYGSGTTPLETYEQVLKRIADFKTISSEAGEDLINWSDQKISLRFTKLGIKSKAWEVSHYVNEYNEHLLSKGITKVDKKKNTSKGKLEEIIKKGEAAIEDSFRYYKQASPCDATAMITEFDLEYLFKVIDSDLKCIKSKLFDRWDKPNGDFKAVALQLCEKSVTKQDYKRIIKWATPAKVTEAFMIRHKDHASTKEVIEYCESASISKTELINEEFHQTCLTKIPANVKYTLNRGLTYQYMVRMNEAEKVSMLKDITNADYTNLEWGTLFGLYSSVSYPLIKNTILSSNNLLKHLSLKLVKENDHEAMIKSATTVGGELDESHKKGIFTRLNYAEKKVVITADKGNGNFEGRISKLSDPECLDLLKETVADGRLERYTTAIFKKLLKSKQSLLDADKIVRAMENPDFLPLNETVILNLTVDTKVELLNKNIYLKDDKIYHSYLKAVPMTSNSLGLNFFKDFKRQDINKVYDSPVASEYRKFLAHTMTKDELETCVKSELSKWHRNTNARELQESFFRHNLEMFGYSFLKQFQDKVLFRTVVGDRRDTMNKRFGSDLFAKLDVSNTIDFMFAD